MPIPMIHAGALGNIPEFLAEQAGWAAVERSFQSIGLPLDVTSYPENRIPWNSIMALLEESARTLGDQQIGLLLCRHTNITTYGTWGRYLLSAPTLREALRRTESSLCYHSPWDRLRLSDTIDGIRLTYRFALVGARGSENTSYCAAGVLLSLIRHYLGSRWRPRCLHLSVPSRRQDDAIAEAFGCEVRLGGEVISFEIPTELLETAPPPTGTPLVTLADVERARRGVPKTTLGAVVTDLLQLQILEKQPSLDQVAWRLGIGHRTLQRRLSEEGVTFRDLERRVFADRARELLDEDGYEITEVAMALAYESPSHFTRAFAKATGTTPSAYRQERQRRDLLSVSTRISRSAVGTANSALP